MCIRDRNETIHRDLKIVSVEDEVQRFAKKLDRRLLKRQNVKMLQFLELVRRLYRMKPFDSV